MSELTASMWLMSGFASLNRT